MAIQIVTTTRNRPWCFNLLEKWVSRQTIKPASWLVINDGHTGYTYNMEQTVCNRQHTDGNSLCQNWLYALDRLTEDKIIILEDDDYIAPDYLAMMSAALDKADLVGLNNYKTYHVGYKVFNDLHLVTSCSLGASGFRSSIADAVRGAAQRCDAVSSPYIDRELFQSFKGSKLTLPNLSAMTGRPANVSFKGMPGTRIGDLAPGLGAFHSGQGSTDSSGEILRQWLGNDAGVYLEVMRA